MLGKEFIGKSCYANFFKLKNKIMLGEFHVSRIHVRQGLRLVVTSYEVNSNIKICA